MHNLTKTLAAMSLLAPLTAHSLGVGDIKLYSALNQKLNAEIALSLAADENLADIQVTLATPDKFDKLGISWSYFLSRVKFQPVLKENGRVVIKMTSDEVVQEPFLDFLVEVSWPKGDIYKEFTVLVDPPAVYQQRQIEAPTTSSAAKVIYNSPSVNTTAQTNLSNLVADGEYGPTSRNDSLWKVAEKVNQHSDISVEQMMMALYKANPDAFYKKNVNALMAGKSLKVPGRAELLKLSKKQANSQFYGQMAAWEGEAVSEPNVQQAITQQAIVEDTSNQLTLVPPAVDDVAGSDTLTANSTDETGLVAENEQLQERLANLEKQFALMQEMMAIKDQQLAVMQNAQSADNLQADAPVLEPDIKQAIVDEKEPASQQITSVDPIASSDSKPAQGVEDTDVVSKKQPAIKPPATVTPPVHKIAKQPVAQQDTGPNYYYISAGILGALAIGGIGWLLWRRRQVEEEINDNSMFATSSSIFLPDAGADDELDVPVLDENSSYDVGTVGESSFLSEFTPSDFDVFETDQAEVDPSSEADVYLAYGRYQQAEELMRQAITDYPDKDDYKLKLLEIFYTGENSEGFEGFSNELAAEGKKQDLGFWSKVMEMGSELLPDSALFLPEQGETDFTVAEDSSEVENDEAAKADDVSPELEEDNSELDFDLSSFSLADDSDISEEQEGEAIAEADSDFKLDLDTDDLGLNSDEPIDSSSLKAEEETKVSDASSDDEIESIEFNTDDLGLDNLDFSTEKPALAEADDELATPESELAEELGNSDFDFDFDEISDAPADEHASDSDDEMDLMVSDLTDMDEFETKIDLAKAYIDMGDESAAKDIVQEVLEKGNDAQKGEAQAIIDKLA